RPGLAISLSSNARSARPAAFSLLVTLGNPKTMLFYVALVPTLIDIGNIGLRDYAIMLAATFVVLIVVLVPYMLLASR
ncbi:LysE family transporter, partial [Rhizobium ruizarguesonis]